MPSVALLFQANSASPMLHLENIPIALIRIAKQVYNKICTLAKLL